MSTKGEPNRKKGGSHMPRATPGSSKLKSNTSNTLATCLGMLLLLIIVTITVVERSPNFPSDPPFIANWNKMHVSQYYFAQGEFLVKPFIIKSLEKDSPTISPWIVRRWSHQFSDPDTASTELGNDVWYSTGTAEASSNNGKTVRLPWAICFVGETSNVLFTKAGDSETGSIDQARKLAQAKPSPPNP